VENSRTPERCVGIFWLFRNEIIIDSTPLSKAESYGTALTHPTGHIKYWNQLRQIGAVPAEVEYEEPPRGRVIFDGRAQRFHLLADKCILGQGNVVTEIMRTMHLPPDKTSKGRDEHYRCFTCLYPDAADDEDF
jgi:hypothetical protein